jgi:diguanylate cyclase (GGDEF)-like protein
VGLRSKLLLISLLLGLVPLALTCAGAYWYFENKLSKEAFHYQRDMLNQLEINASSEIRSLEEMMRQLAADGVLGKYFETESELRPYLMQPAVLRLFAGYGRLNSHVKAVALYDVDGKVDTYYSLERRILSGDQGAEIISVHEELPGAVHVTVEAASEGAWQEDMVRATIPVVRSKRSRKTLKSEDRTFGYLAVWHSLAPWQDMLKQTKMGNTQFFFVDDFGRVFIGGSTLPFESLDVEAMKALAVSDEGYPELYLNDHGHTQVLSMRLLVEGMWLGALIDRDAIVRDARNFLWVMLPALLVVLLVTGLIFYLQVIRLLIQPVEHLTNATRKIARGNYKQKLNINSKDELGELALAFQHMGDQLEESSKRIRELAFFDPLTSLPNRATLKNSLVAAIKKARRSHTKLAVLFIDLDDFKKVNDSFGHAAGDELLMQVAKRLQASVRQDEMLAGVDGELGHDSLVSRRGGDEFNAIVTGVRRVHEVAVVAERIIENVIQPVQLMGAEVSVSASVGVAIYPDDGESADVLLRNADLAMYEAKAQGKNNYHVFTEAINQQVHERLNLEHAIHDGLRKGEFELYYQPKINLQNMQVVGLEALIRWNHPQRGLVSPAEFIPLAEESSLIFDIGNWVLGEALNQLQMWGDRVPPGVRVAINISPRQLAQETIAEQIVEMAGHFEVPLNRLDVEVTETSLLHDEAAASKQLQALRSRGVSISLDDFGTGYSSLTFLRRLPIDVVKIDRSFVAQLATEGDDQAIVKSLMEMCRRLKLRIVAEGIETADQLSFLVANDCHEAQGYLFSKPMPADKVVAFLRQPEYLAI